ncbi:MAG: 16S rRNA (uracil(1498)-N(3))-methyltransferase [Campylobacterales bacterium]|nr:16S rRNA (uracil(1498)-N(3))-methyltransferase [Campylobacterales bacterium]
MQFFYHEKSGDQKLVIDAELHKYIFKVRRHSSEDELCFRNLVDKNIYVYKVESINRRDAILALQNSFEKIVEPSQKLHVGWCVVDPKTVEKQIASYNELGVGKITFIYCKYSQKQFKINFEKLNKILQNSSSQCGRSSIIELEESKSLNDFLKIYPNSYMFNFSQNHIKNQIEHIQTIVLGCEGGFSKDEIENFDPSKIVGIDSNLILRSETALGLIASYITN